MNRQSRIYFIFAATLPLFALACFFAAGSLSAAGAGTAILIAVFLAIFVFAAVSSIFADGRAIEPAVFFPVLAAVYVLLVLRVLCFNHETGDYVTFLKPWTDYFRQNGGFAALSESIGNYNIPYLTFLALFSYIPVSELYLIKLLSVGFDLLLAAAAAKLVLLATGSDRRKLLAFAAALLLPTVFLNGAYWGQCDSIYGGLALLAVYFILSDRPWLSMAALALSFSFKLQAVFIFPLFFVFLLTGRLKLRHIPLFPAVYIAAVSPALIAGRPFLDTLLLYVSQGGTVGSALNYNSPSVYSLFKYVSNPTAAANAGIICAFAFCALMFVFLFLCRKRLNNTAYILAALAFSLAIPLLLPHMHDRYFFLADALSLVAAFCVPGIVWCAPMVTFASLLGYHAYLRGTFFMPMSRGFWLLAIALVSTIAALALRLLPGRDKSRKRR